MSKELSADSFREMADKLRDDPSEETQVEAKELRKKFHDWLSNQSLNDQVAFLKKLGHKNAT